MPAAKPAAQAVNKEAATISGASTVAKRIPAPQVRCGMFRRCLRVRARRALSGDLPPHAWRGSNVLAKGFIHLTTSESQVVRRCRLEMKPQSSVSYCSDSTLLSG